jgi:hypothetical protein
MFAEPLRRFSPDDKMQDNTVPHFATQLRARRIESFQVCPQYHCPVSRPVDRPEGA